MEMQLRRFQSEKGEVGREGGGDEVRRKGKGEEGGRGEEWEGLKKGIEKVRVGEEHRGSKKVLWSIKEKEKKKKCLDGEGISREGKRGVHGRVSGVAIGEGT